MGRVSQICGPHNEIRRTGKTCWVYREKPCPTQKPWPGFQTSCLVFPFMRQAAFGAWPSQLARSVQGMTNRAQEQKAAWCRPQVSVATSAEPAAGTATHLSSCFPLKVCFYSCYLYQQRGGSRLMVARYKERTAIIQTLEITHVAI